MIRNFITLLAFLASLMIAAVPAHAGGKHALLIGNASYQKVGEGSQWSSLPNPVNDVEMVATSLRSIGFEVTLVADGTWSEMRSAVDRFSNAIDDADIVVFYYAGHGFEYGRRNYLVPVDASLRTSADKVDQVFIEFEALADRLTHDGTTIFMLDACRTGGNVSPTAVANGQVTRSAPAPVIFEPTTRQAANVSAGIREFDFEPGARVAVLYSTGRGIPAYDAAPPPKNISPFAIEVASKVTVPKVDVSLVFNAIRQGVFERTQDYWPPQVPFTYNSLSPNTFLADAVADEALAIARPAAAAGDEPGRRPIALTLDEMARIDEPILIMRVLAQHSLEEIKALVAQGDPLATYLLGYMQHFGIGTDKDLAAARATLEAAAKQATPFGQLELAYFLDTNARDAADKERAVALYSAAAEQNYVKARAHYGRVLIAGTILPQTPENYAAGVAQLRRSAEGGYPYALYGLIYAVPEERDQWMAKLHELSRAGRGDADLQLCSILVREQALAEAEPFCQGAARAGYPDAFAHLALGANGGWAGPRSIDDARFWMRQALSRGDLDVELCAQMLSLQYELAVETGTQGSARILNCSRT